MQEFLFVGRDSELEVLERTFASVTGTGGHVDLVVGEPGAGKTALASTFAAGVADGGAPVHTGHCIEGIAPPYWPWIEVGRSICESIDVVQVVGSVAVGSGYFAPFLSAADAKRVETSGPAPDHVKGGEAKFFFFQAFYELLRAATTNSPSLVIVEDLHWADDGSSELLVFLSREIDRLPLHIICTYRNTDVRRATPIAKAVGQVLGSGRSAHIRLQDLSVDAISRLLEAEQSTGPEQSEDSNDTEEKARAIHDRTGGNALFVRTLIEAGDSVGSPESIQHLVGLYLARLAADQLAVISHAAILGTEYSIEVLIRFAGGEDPGRVLSAIDAASEVGLITLPKGSRDRYRFRHDIIRETILEELSLSDAVDLHARAATLLESERERGRAVSAAELYHHFSQAEIVHGVQKTGEAAIEAVRSAINLHDVEGAITIVDSALPRILNKDDVAATTLLALKFSTHLRGVGTIEVLRSTIEAALTIALSSPTLDPARALFNVITLVGFWPDRSLRMLRQLADRLADEGDASDELFVRRTTTLINANSMLTGTLIDEQANALTEKMATDAAIQGDLESVVRLRRQRTFAFHFAGRFEDAVREAEKLESLAGSDDDPVAIEAAENMIDNLFRIGRANEIPAILDRMIPVCLGLPFSFPARLVLQRGLNSLVQFCYWDRYDQLNQTLLEIRPRFNLQQHNVSARYRAHLERDEIDEAREIYMGTLADKGSLWPIAMVPRFLVRSGDVSLVPTIPAALEAATGFLNWAARGEALAGTARAFHAWSESDDTSARAAVNEVDPELVDTGHESVGYIYALLGDMEQAVQLFETGVEKHGDIPVDLGWYHFHLAEVFAKSDSGRFAGELKTARALAVQHKQVLLQRRIAQLQRTPMTPAESWTAALSAHKTAPGSSRASNDDQNGLTAREKEILSYVAKGFTNKDIAEFLGISERTVSTHLTHAYEKAGVANRAEATSFAIRNALVDE